jgi:hypothetical protein
MLTVAFTLEGLPLAPPLVVTPREIVRRLETLPVSTTLTSLLQFTVYQTSYSAWYM